jgi:hypothetical protein
VGRLRFVFSSRISLRVHLVLWLCLCTSVCVIWQVCVLLFAHVESGSLAVSDALDFISALPTSHKEKKRRK